MEQQRALNAIEQYLLLAKNAPPRAAAELVIQATSAPGAFIFAELLEKPSIKALKDSSDYSGHHELLQIFSWGTWKEYEAAQSRLPALSPSQVEKLKMLTLLTPLGPPTQGGLKLKPSTYSYRSLMDLLSLPNARSLEMLVTKANYQGLMSSTFDPLHQMVNVHSLAPLRDPAPGSIPYLIEALDKWRERCDKAYANIMNEIEEIKRKSREERRREREAKAEVEALVAGKEDKPGTGDRDKDRKDERKDESEAMELEKEDAPQVRRSGRRVGSK